ncbi:MAG: hypothetical protein A2Z08_02025 [Deltaproteobacteria bacterium RBG_16_54_11]|nr:MAG: hypothetical protein A2Z08_02025 [Deltaproteobacteria bacterium RBG_16_54_11]
MMLFPCLWPRRWLFSQKGHLRPSQEVIREAVSIFTSWTGEEMREGECLYRATPGAAEDLAGLRVINLDSPALNENPFPIEIAFERRRREDCQCGKGAVYAGIHLAALLSKGLSARRVLWGDKPLFITRDYIATFDRDDLRWHLRYGVFSFPVLISLPGIIEAPARPREYYLLRSQGIPDAMMPDSLRDRYLTVNDPRLPRVLAGILLQAFFYYQSGDPFCPDPFCSLYHAHWQEELLRSQRDEPYIVCLRHRQALEKEERWLRG